MMQMSARGSSDSRAAASARLTRRTGEPWSCATRRHCGGFTLLEMLVVLMIAGLLLAVVTLAPARNRRTDLAEEAQRLATMLESADDEAQIRSVPIAWQPVDGGYQFYQRGENGKWNPLVDELLAPHRWAAEVTGVSIRYSGSSDSASRIVFGEESMEAPVTVTLESAGARVAVVGTGIGSFGVTRP